MLCQTPAIELPEGFSIPEEGKRRRRDTSVLPHQSRIKRDAEKKPLNDENMQFYLGFKLDGVDTYRLLCLNITNTYFQSF